MTSKGYSNDIKVQCSSWVVAVIMGVCLSDPAKVGLSLSLSLGLSLAPSVHLFTHTHTHHYAGPRPRRHHTVGGKRGKSLRRIARGGGGEKGSDC